MGSYLYTPGRKVKGITEKRDMEIKMGKYLL